jgi:uncharacterized membrane protein HdeD (DUF308 family)
MKNSKSIILQVVGVMILAIGAYILYEHFTNEMSSSSMLSGIGAILSGIAIIVISKSKAITK